MTASSISACGFSRKVGEANYGSRGASVNLELELATEAVRDSDGLNEKIRRLFSLAKKAGDDELNGQAAPAEPPARGNVPVRDADGSGGNGDGQPGNGSAATNKQVKLIMDLARTRKMSLSVVERLCRVIFAWLCSDTWAAPNGLIVVRLDLWANRGSRSHERTYPEDGREH